VIPNQNGHTISWLKSPLEMINFEMQHSYPGSETVVSHLMSILLIMVIRYWILHHADGDGGWLSALYHPQIGAVLAEIHQQPAYPWTVDSLAKAVNLSRSGLAAQFSALVGEAPMHYLTRWRMQLAVTLLLDEPYATLDQIAQQVGYSSAYAFSKAFKRWFGMAPSAYRQQYQPADAASSSERTASGVVTGI
ncbi:MAG: helix-turn-helix transcriptional regulator, partial [Armatimonadetes bacterium]|nr:helix-turn-helix transcriptional regulator [Anaerolineae bacterium]